MAWLDLEEDIAEEMGDLRLDRVRSEHGLSTSRKTAWFSDEFISEVKRQNSLADKRSAEARSAAVRAGNAKRPKERRVEIARNAGIASRKKQLATMTPAQRSAARQKQTDRMTPEQRSEIARRSAATRKARRAA